VTYPKAAWGRLNCELTLRTVLLPKHVSSPERKRSFAYPIKSRVLRISTRNVPAGRFHPPASCRLREQEAGSSRRRQGGVRLFPNALIPKVDDFEEDERIEYRAGIL